jgi:hypothetical protein
MIWQRYCVTVMDNWTPIRTFLTLAGAKRFYQAHQTCAHVYKWEGGEWRWMFGARDAAKP